MDSKYAASAAVTTSVKAEGIPARLIQSIWKPIADSVNVHAPTFKLGDILSGKKSKPITITFDVHTFVESVLTSLTKSSVITPKRSRRRIK